VCVMRVRTMYYWCPKRECEHGWNHRVYMHAWKLTSLQTSQTCNSDSLRREVLEEAEHLRAELEKRTASLHEAERTCREAEAAIDELQRGQDTLLLLRANSALSAPQQQHVRGRDEVQALLLTTQVAAQEVSDVSAQVRQELLACLGAQHALGQTVVVLRAEEAQLLRVVEEQKVALRHVQGECESARSALQILLREKQSAHEALGAVLGEVEARKVQQFVEDERERGGEREIFAQWEGVGEILSDPTNGLCTLNRRILHLVQEQCADEAAHANAVHFGVLENSNVCCTVLNVLHYLGADASESVSGGHHQSQPCPWIAAEGGAAVGSRRARRSRRTWKVAGSVEW
jgi:hypothetical protein